MDYHLTWIRRNRREKTSPRRGKASILTQPALNLPNLLQLPLKTHPSQKINQSFSINCWEKLRLPHQPLVFAQSGITEPIMCIKSVLKNVPWIVDSGASDHMTQESKLFNSYISCSGKQKVFVANGSNIPVHGKGSIAINKHITLDSVLHVPEMSTNLLSISKLAKSQTVQ